MKVLKKKVTKTTVTETYVESMSTSTLKKKTKTKSEPKTKKKAISKKPKHSKTTKKQENPTRIIFSHILDLLDPVFGSLRRTYSIRISRLFARGVLEASGIPKTSPNR